VNLLSPLPDARAAEQIQTVLTRPGLRVERIVSLGQASPPGFWYDQAEGEWALVLAGTAKLRFADEPEARLLRPGDWLDIARTGAIASTGPTRQPRRYGWRYPTADATRATRPSG